MAEYVWIQILGKEVKGGSEQTIFFFTLLFISFLFVLLFLSSEYSSLEIVLKKLSSKDR